MPVYKIDTTSAGPVHKGRKQRIAPCMKQLKLHLDYLRDVAEREPDNYYPEMARIARESYWFYLWVICGYRWLDPWDHGEEIVPFIQENWGSPMMFLLPRGAGKTGTITIPIFPWTISRDPTFTAGIANATEEKAGEFTRSAAAIIADAKLYRECFPEIVPSDKWGEAGYRITLNDAEEQFLGRADPSLKPFGVGSNLTGSHLRGFIADDLINEQSSKSEAERQKARGFLGESFNTVDPGGVYIVCGTRWRFDDFYGEIEDDKIVGPFGSFKILKRGAERYVQDDQGNPYLEVYNAHRTYVDQFGKDVQVGYTPEFLLAQKKNLGTLYYALYQNTPLSDADSQFEVERVQQHIEFPGELGPVVQVGVECESAGPMILQQILKIMREQNRIFSVAKLTAPKKDKHARIRAVLQPMIDNGNINIRDDLWRQNGNIGTEIRQFDKGEDDCLDALTYNVLKAPKWIAGKPSGVYITVDMAYTAERESNHTCILAGAYLRDVHYTLDCVKFKTPKIETIASQLFKVYDKFQRKQYEVSKPGARVSAVHSLGNAPRRRRLSRGRRIDNIWGFEEHKPQEDK